MPFADYLCMRFKVFPTPRNPRLPFWLPSAYDPEISYPAGFADVTRTDMPPFELDVFSLFIWLGTSAPSGFKRYGKSIATRHG